jgi:hypothetical protein
VQEVLSYSSAASTFDNINVPLSLIEQYIYFSSLILDKFHCQCVPSMLVPLSLFSDFAHAEASTSYTRNGPSVVGF